MTEYMVVDHYPGDAAAGACYLSRATRGKIVETREGEDAVERDERVIITPAYIDYEGRVCLGERTVRHMAHLLGMYDEWRAQELADAYGATLADRDELSERLAAALSEIDALRAQASLTIAKVYVSADGKEHASKSAAVEQSERVLTGRPARGLRRFRPIGGEEAPAPASKELAR